MLHRCIAAIFAFVALGSSAPLAHAVVDASLDPYSINVCDLTGDGTTELVVATPGEALISNGAVTVYDGATMQPIALLASGSGESLFGISVSASADIDLDGRPDLAVAGVEFAAGEPSHVVMHFYSSVSWKELAFIRESLQEFADDTEVVLVGDADASGMVDLMDAVTIAGVQSGEPGVEDVNRDGTVDSLDVFDVVDRAVLMDAETSFQVGQIVAAQARASWWWCTKKGIWIGARIGLFITTIAGCEVNPPLCVVSLLCQACGILTDITDFILQCFTDPIPEMLDAIDSIRWACDLCTAGTTLFNPGVLKEGIKRIWRQFAGMASATMANEFSPCGFPE